MRIRGRSQILGVRSFVLFLALQNRDWVSDSIFSLWLLLFAIVLCPLSLFLSSSRVTLDVVP